MNIILLNLVMLMNQDQSKYIIYMYTFVVVVTNRHYLYDSQLPPNQGGKFTGFGNPQCKYFPFFWDFFVCDRKLTKP